jgi:hypothetical protein
VTITAAGVPKPVSPVDAFPWFPSLEVGSVRSCLPHVSRIDPWLVLRLARYRRREDVGPAIWEATTAMVGRAQDLIQPAAVIGLDEVASVGGAGVRLSGGAAFSGEAVTRLLGGCPLAAAFSLTLGPRLEDEARRLADRHEFLEAFLLDTAGWAALEVLVRGLRLSLSAWARARGLRATHRLAPGYRDWPLTEQGALLAILGAAPGAVSLSAHGTLVPFKSLTGLFGLGRAVGT